MGGNGKHLSGVALRLSLPKRNLYKLCGLRSAPSQPYLQPQRVLSAPCVRSSVTGKQTQRYSLQGAYASFYEVFTPPPPPQAPLVAVLQKIKTERKAWAMGRDTPLGNCDLEQVTCPAGADAEIPFHSNIQSSSRSLELGPETPRRDTIQPWF